MTFVAYAQNFEDVMLMRALKNVPHGFYIDIGANDPTHDSVTKAFYEKGWRGINCEPLLTHYEDLVRERSRDINLQCAVGDHEGEIEIWACDVRGWATTTASVIQGHEALGKSGTLHRARLTTLTTICNDYPTDTIHFLKIDVEGAEAEVIRGIDFKKIRPWIVIVESTLPNSTIFNFENWESHLVSNQYAFAYTDGINRFYVAHEHAYLGESLQHPPNVFDDFVTYGQYHASERAKRAEANEALMQDLHAAQITQIESQITQIESQCATEVNRLQNQINMLLTSTSWRLTKPLRWAMVQARLIRQHGLLVRLKALSRRIMRKTSQRQNSTTQMHNRLLDEIIGRQPRAQRTLCNIKAAMSVQKRN